jgi:hypothetical protein
MKKKPVKTPKSMISRVDVGLYGLYIMGIDDMTRMGLKPGDRVRVTKLNAGEKRAGVRFKMDVGCADY